MAITRDITEMKLKFENTFFVKIWKYIFREYLKNQKRYDRGLFSKNDYQDLAHLEPPRMPRGSPDNHPLLVLFDADANGLYRNPLRCL